METTSAIINKPLDPQYTDTFEPVYRDVSNDSVEWIEVVSTYGRDVETQNGVNQSYEFNIPGGKFLDYSKAHFIEEFKLKKPSAVAASDKFFTPVNNFPAQFFNYCEVNVGVNNQNMQTINEYGTIHTQLQRVHGSKEWSDVEGVDSGWIPDNVTLGHALAAQTVIGGKSVAAGYIPYGGDGQKFGLENKPNFFEDLPAQKRRKWFLSGLDANNNLVADAAETTTSAKIDASRVNTVGKKFIHKPSIIGIFQTEKIVNFPVQIKFRRAANENLYQRSIIQTTTTNKYTTYSADVAVPANFADVAAAYAYVKANSDRLKSRAQSIAWAGDITTSLKYDSEVAAAIHAADNLINSARTLGSTDWEFYLKSMVLRIPVKKPEFSIETAINAQLLEAKTILYPFKNVKYFKSVDFTTSSTGTEYIELQSLSIGRPKRIYLYFQCSDRANGTIQRDANDICGCESLQLLINDNQRFPYNPIAMNLIEPIEIPFTKASEVYNVIEPIIELRKAQFGDVNNYKMAPQINEFNFAHFPIFVFDLSPSGTDLPYPNRDNTKITLLLNKFKLPAGVASAKIHCISVFDSVLEANMIDKTCMLNI